jgi:hypothetical protein
MDLCCTVYFPTCTAANTDKTHETKSSIIKQLVKQTFES